MSLSASKSAGIYAGRTYKVKYRAKNAIGYGPFSDIAFILAARKPDTPIPPTISIVGTNASVRFYLPYNGGANIYKAQIVIKTHDGLSYIEDTINCNATNEDIFQNRKCLIPLAYLRGTTWNLVYGDYIIAKLIVENEIGPSSQSAETILPPMM